MKQSEFLNIINPFKDKVFRIAKRLLVSNEEAEDATQEVFIKLWNKSETLSKYNSIEALAVTMTKNYCLDQLKSKRATNVTLAHTNYANNENIVTHLENLDSLQIVSKIIDELSEQQKIIYQMREIEAYEYAEIATILDMNETAIRVSVSRTRKIIKDKLMAKHNYGITTH